jgi:hypothetical protein
LAIADLQGLESRRRQRLELAEVFRAFIVLLGASRIGSVGGQDDSKQ